MFWLIVGAAASGKSAYAEAVACGNAAHPRVYIATLEPHDDAENRARIARHQAQRAAARFVTIECPRNLGSLDLAAVRGASVLLDTLGTLVANELYAADGSLADPAAVEDAVVAGVRRLAHASERLVVVTDEVFSAGANYGGETLVYLRVLAAINRRLAQEAACVVEVVSGCPVVLKGVAPQ